MIRVIIALVVLLTGCQPIAQGHIVARPYGDGYIIYEVQGRLENVTFEIVIQGADVEPVEVMY